MERTKGVQSHFLPQTNGESIPTLFLVLCAHNLHDMTITTERLREILTSLDPKTHERMSIYVGIFPKPTILLANQKFSVFDTGNCVEYNVAKNDINTLWEVVFTFIHKHRAEKPTTLWIFGKIPPENRIILIDLLCTHLVDYAFPLTTLGLDKILTPPEKERVSNCVGVPTCRLESLYFAFGEGTEAEYKFQTDFNKQQEIKIPKQDRILTLLYATESQPLGPLGKLPAHVIQGIDEFI